MAEGGLFSGIGDVIDKVKKPEDLLLFIGLGLLAWGVVKGPFSMTNEMISWGAICITASLALRLLLGSMTVILDTYHDYHFFHWGKILGGLGFAIACLILIFHQFAGHWPPLHNFLPRHR